MNNIENTGEMAQKLSEFVAHQEDLGVVPDIHMAHNHS